MPAGRPSKLTPELIEQAKAYVAGEYEVVGDSIPSVVGLASLLNVTRTTLYKWANEDSEEISNILEACVEKQQQVLLNKGLSGDFNATITKLVLGKHGYHERQEHTGADGQPIQTETKITSVTFTGPDE